MKGKILNAEYNPGFDSWVRKETKYGTFSNSCYILEQDEDIENSFDGCRLAEKKCDIQAYQEKAKWMRERYNGARILYDNLLQKWDQDNPVMIDIGRQVNYLKNEWDKSKEFVNRLKDYYPMYVNQLETERRNMRKKQVS